MSQCLVTLALLNRFGQSPGDNANNKSRSGKSCRCPSRASSASACIWKTSSNKQADLEAKLAHCTHLQNLVRNCGGHIRQLPTNWCDIKNDVEGELA